MELLTIVTQAETISPELSIDPNVTSKLISVQKYLNKILKICRSE